jgi:hypothetical protein
VRFPNSRIIVWSAETPSSGDGEEWSITSATFDAHPLECSDRERRGAVLAHDEVDVGYDDVARARVRARVRGQDLLRDGLARAHSSAFALSAMKSL